MRNVWLLGGLTTVLAVVALIIAIIALLSLSNAPPPGESDPGGYTVDLVRQALRRYDAEGREATLNYYNSPDSVEGEWYVFIVDEHGKVAAHSNQALLGRDLKGDLGVDVAGYRFGDVMLGATEEGLWVDYVFLNPTTGHQEVKHSWVAKHDGLIFGSGWYQALPSSPLDVTKAELV